MKRLIAALIVSLVAVGTAWAQTHDFWTSGPCAPTVETSFRGKDYNSQTYCTMTWTVVLPDSGGEITVYDLYEYPAGTTAIRDSMEFRLLPQTDYNDAFIGDSIVVYLWEETGTDSAWVIGVADFKDAVNIHGQ